MVRPNGSIMLGSLAPDAVKIGAPAAVVAPDLRADLRR
jgi:hypothetical protein